jgi:hypothetical protein
MKTIKNKFGLLHSYNDKPSLIDNGDLYWHKNGLLHRDNDMPSIIMNNGDNYWHINGVPNRLDVSLPHIEMSNGEKHYILENGGKKIISPLKEEWFNKDNKLHREDGPAYIEYYENENGNIWREVYYINGNIHREDGPACIYYYENENGNIWREVYYINGNIHREDGPHVIDYFENGSIKAEWYYLNNTPYSKEDYLEKIKGIKSFNKRS